MKKYWSNSCIRTLKYNEGIHGAEICGLWTWINHRKLPSLRCLGAAPNHHHTLSFTSILFWKLKIRFGNNISHYLNLNGIGVFLRRVVHPSGSVVLYEIILDRVMIRIPNFSQNSYRNKWRNRIRGLIWMHADPISFIKLFGKSFVTIFGFLAFSFR